MNKSLKQDFEARKTFFTNRSSALFPIYFQGPHNDLILSWLNYWTIKNNIDADVIAVNLRVYDETGDLVLRETLGLCSENNSISVSGFLKRDVFSGMAEIEIISTSNIRYTFPGVSAFYKSGSFYSCVHPAGRIKGSDEIHNVVKTEETNWICKFGEDVTPFFHYVNGGSDQSVSLTINLYAENGEVAESVNVLEHLKPFGSKVYFIDELFNSKILREKMFVGVMCSNDSVFRRMVVGNYHKKIQHLEVTHSFQKQENYDFCPENEGAYQSYFLIPTDKNLSLTCRVFPTSCSKDFKVTESTLPFVKDVLSEPSDTNKLDEGYGEISLDDSVRMSVLWLSGSKVSSRLSINFLYKVKGVDSVFSTDIGAGALSSVYPPKYNHWGSGVLGNGYDFALMITNVTNGLDATNAEGCLRIFGLGKIYEFDVACAGQASTSIVLSELLKNSDLKDSTEEKIFTWFLSLDKPNSETSWVSFRQSDGCVVGDHGF